MNEELQSTNEELETSKEELQSTNEELVTVNTELQKKVDELSESNNDINNLLSSTEIGTIFLDTSLRIKRFTPAMTKIFNLIQSDIGRPISHITSNVQHDDLCKNAEDVLRTLDRKEMEIQNKDGIWYAMRIGPYRTTENVIDGVVITFVDITSLKHGEELKKEIENRKSVEEELREQQNLFKKILTTTPDLLVLKNRDGVCLAANAVFCELVEKSEDEIVGKTESEIFSRSDAEKYRKEDVKVMETGKTCVREEKIGKKSVLLARAPVF